jgi:hypothetical protein
LQSRSRFGVLVVVIDVFSDGHDELLQVSEDATPKLIAGQVRFRRDRDEQGF